MEISYCNGCGFCGDNKPGICCKQDQMQEIYPHPARAARIIFVSPVRFGGFGGHMKKAIDRFSPQGLGTYVIRNGEMRHEMRYPGPASVVSIGIMVHEDESEEKTFRLASSRIAACLFAQKAASGESLRGAQLLVLCSPVFIHSLPWPFQEVLTALADSPTRGGLSGLKVITLIHSGYLEDIQRQTCFEMCRHFCRETGMVYSGGLGFGASPLIGGRPLESTGHLMRWVRRALAEMAICIADDRDLSRKAAGLIHRHFALMPRWLMILPMKLKVEGDAKKAGVDYRARPYSIDC